VEKNGAEKGGTIPVGRGSAFEILHIHGSGIADRVELRKQNGMMVTCGQAAFM
jgi:hypothetical protein